MDSGYVEQLKAARAKFVETRRAQAEAIANQADPANVNQAQSFQAIQSVLEAIDQAITEESGTAIAVYSKLGSGKRPTKKKKKKSTK